MGRTLFERYHDAEFQEQHQKFRVSGLGLQAVKVTQPAGKGAIVVSGHFGHWEAIRAVLKMKGMESAAIIRTHTNPHDARRIRAGIEAGGIPIRVRGWQREPSGDFDSSPTRSTRSPFWSETTWRCRP